MNSMLEHLLEHSGLLALAKLGKEIDCDLKVSPLVRQISRDSILSTALREFNEGLAG